MQIIPAASGGSAPAAAEYVQATGASGLPSSGLSFESVLAASVQGARTGQGPGGGGQTADSPLGHGQGTMALRLMAALRRKAGEEPEAHYLLAGMPATPTDTNIPQTDGSAETDDAVAHILQGDNFQALMDTAQAQAASRARTDALSGQGANADFSREMLARMPQTPDSETQAAHAASAAATDGGSCPLENVNDLISHSMKTEIQKMAANRQAAPTVSTEAAEATTEPRPIETRAETPDTGAGPGGQSTESDSGDTPEAADLGAMGRPLDIGALRAQGELQNAQPAAAPPATATAETLMDTMVEKLSLERQGDSHQMEIQLRPEHLGKVTIQLTLDGTGVQAKIRTEDPGVRGLIGSQVNQLIEALEQKGVRLTAVDVTYQAPQSQDFNQRGGGREQMSQENRNRGLAAQAISRGGVAADAETPYEALAVDTYVSQAAESAAYPL